MVKTDIKHKNTVDFNVIKFWCWNVDNHFPFIRNCNIISINWKDMIWPVSNVTPKSDCVLSYSINSILRTVVSASDTINVNPLMNLFVSATDT